MPRLFLPFLIATLAHAMLLVPDPDWIQSTSPPLASTRTIRMRLMSRATQPTPSDLPETQTPKRATKPENQISPQPVQPKITKVVKKKESPNPLPKKRPLPKADTVKPLETPETNASTIDQRPEHAEPIEVSRTMAMDGMESIAPSSVTTAKARQKAERLESEPASGGPPSPAKSVDQGAHKAMVDHVAVPLYQSNPSPTYPRLARKRGYQGEVLLEALVSSSGLVDKVKVFRTSGYPILDRQALKTVRQWRFEPAIKGSRPVAMWVRVPMRFQLHSP